MNPTPAWLPGPVNTLLVYGGSFDPIHNAHIQLPQIVRARVGADVVGYVPAANAPHKQGMPRTDAVHRLAMLRLALQGRTDVAVLTHELDRAGSGRPSYTVETLELLRAELGPSVRLRLLFGADMLRIFHKWYRWADIIALAEPVVMIRPPWTAQALLADLDPALDGREWAARIVEVPPSEISSTLVRQRYQAGLSLAGYVPEPVERYIREHGLYAAHS